MAGDHDPRSALQSQKMEAMKGLYDDGVVGMAEPIRNGLDLGDQSLKRANFSGVVASSLSEVIPPHDAGAGRT